MEMKYRADIDGLRALAVLAVILNHAGFSLFSGGFVGVDVFFVISGYLITLIITREIERKEFSVLKFYERRIRRIFPALFMMLGAVSLLSLWLYSSNHLIEFSKSLLATTLFYSNFLFWSQSGYFDAPSLLKPLLHTWSLAVEEQYYIFFPLILLVLYRYGKSQRKNILIFITALSFIFSLYGVYLLNDNGATAFYLLPMRAWELLFGGLIALGVFPSKANVIIRNFASLIGLLLISISIFYYTDKILFPGWFAILPVFGTGLIIWAGDGNASVTTFISKFLGVRPIVFIGLISYSLYLWHWPILVFAEYYSITKLESNQVSLILLIIFVVSTLTWHFIEKPFRSYSFINKSQVYGFAGVSMFVCTFAALVLYKNDGFNSISYFRLPENPILSSVNFDQCTLAARNLDLEIKLCQLGNLDGSAHSEFLLWGDSQAKALAYGVNLSAEKFGIAGNLAHLAACPPGLYDYSDNTVPKAKISQCRKTNQFIIDYLALHPEIKTVILFARWDIYPAQFQEEHFFVGLDNTIKHLIEMDKKVVIVTATPMLKQDISFAYFIALRTNRDINSLVGKEADKYLDETNTFREFVNLLKKEYQIDIIEPWQVLCNEKTCPAVMKIGNQDIMLYSDTFHLSVPASTLLISPLFDPLFETLQIENNQIP